MSPISRAFRAYNRAYFLVRCVQRVHSLFTCDRLKMAQSVRRSALGTRNYSNPHAAPHSCTVGSVLQTGPSIDEIAQERLEAFKLKVHKQERLERMWTTHGSAARSKCSIWAPIVTHSNIVQRNKVAGSR